MTESNWGWTPAGEQVEWLRLTKDRLKTPNSIDTFNLGFKSGVTLVVEGRDLAFHFVGPNKMEESNDGA